MPRLKLRQDSIRSLAYLGAGHGKSQCIYWDAGLPGFGLRVFPNGRSSYVCSYRYQMRKRMADLGRSDVLTLDQARKKAKSYFASATDGKDPKSGIDQMRLAVSAKELAARYLEQHAKLKKRSWKADESFLNRYFIPRLGTHLAASVSRAEISAIHAEIGKAHPYAANHYIGVVRKMFNFGRRIGLVPEEMRNPGSEIERFPEHRRRRYVTPAELPVLAQAINAEPNEFAAHAFWLLLLTGLRRNEILGAKWADIDWDAKTLFIGKTKNGEPVLTPLSRAAIARLDQIPKIKDNPYIICGTMPKQPLRYLDSMWRRIRAETGFRDLRIHDLRRTVGSWLVQDGASLHLVGAVLNHKDQKTTAGYAYFQTVDRHAALERHGNAILEIAHRPISQHPQARFLDSPPPKGTKLTIRKIKRQELYELVWTEPLSTLAPRLGISDVGLAKVCKRAEIPVPPRGHWAKAAAGHVIRRTDLAERPELASRPLRFKTRSTVNGAVA